MAKPDLIEAVATAVLNALCTGKFGCACPKCKVWMEGWEGRQFELSSFLGRGQLSRHDSTITIRFKRDRDAEKAFEFLIGEDMRG